MQHDKQTSKSVEQQKGRHTRITRHPETPAEEDEEYEFQLQIAIAESLREEEERRDGNEQTHSITRYDWEDEDVFVLKYSNLGGDERVMKVTKLHTLRDVAMRIARGLGRTEEEIHLWEETPERSANMVKIRDTTLVEAGINSTTVLKFSCRRPVYEVPGMDCRRCGTWLDEKNRVAWQGSRCEPNEIRVWQCSQCLMSPIGGLCMVKMACCDKIICRTCAGGHMGKCSETHSSSILPEGQTWSTKYLTKLEDKDGLKMDVNMIEATLTLLNGLIEVSTATGALIGLRDALVEAREEYRSARETIEEHVRLKSEADDPTQHCLVIQDEVGKSYGGNPAIAVNVRQGEQVGNVVFRAYQSWHCTQKFQHVASVRVDGKHYHLHDMADQIPSGRHVLVKLRGCRGGAKVSLVHLELTIERIHPHSKSSGSQAHEEPGTPEDAPRRRQTTSALTEPGHGQRRDETTALPAPAEIEKASCVFCGDEIGSEDFAIICAFCEEGPICYDCSAYTICCKKDCCIRCSGRHGFCTDEFDSHKGRKPTDHANNPQPSPIGRTQAPTPDSKTHKDKTGGQNAHTDDNGIDSQEEKRSSSIEEARTREERKQDRKAHTVIVRDGDSRKSRAVREVPVTVAEGETIGDIIRKAYMVMDPDLAEQLLKHVTHATENGRYCQLQEDASSLPEGGQVTAKFRGCRGGAKETESLERPQESSASSSGCTQERNTEATPLDGKQGEILLLDATTGRQLRRLTDGLEEDEDIVLGESRIGSILRKPVVVKEESSSHEGQVDFKNDVMVITDALNRQGDVASFDSTIGSCVLDGHIKVVCEKWSQTSGEETTDRTDGSGGPEERKEERKQVRKFASWNTVPRTQMETDEKSRHLPLTTRTDFYDRRFVREGGYQWPGNLSVDFRHHNRFIWEGTQSAMKAGGYKIRSTDLDKVETVLLPRIADRQIGTTVYETSDVFYKIADGWVTSKHLDLQQLPDGSRIEFLFHQGELSVFLFIVAYQNSQWASFVELVFVGDAMPFCEGGVARDLFSYSLDYFNYEF